MKRYLIAGLLVWVPLGITIWVVHFLLTTLDQTLLLLPHQWRPEVSLGYRIPGLGVVLAFLVLLATGVVAANILGARLIRFWERILGRIPLVKSIYGSVKQVSDTLLSDSGNAFRKALLVEFPHQNSWTIAFQTGSPAPSVAKHFGEEHVSVYVPTTPNPTSGYFIMVPRSRTRDLDMSVEEALKYIVSMGVVVPRSAVPGSRIAPPVDPVAPPLDPVAPPLDPVAPPGIDSPRN